MSKHDATIRAIEEAFAPAGFTRFDVGDPAFDPAPSFDDYMTDKWGHPEWADES